MILNRARFYRKGTVSSNSIQSALQPMRLWPVPVVFLRIFPGG